MRARNFLHQLRDRRSAAQPLSLKARLGISFSLLMLVAIFFASLALYQQHRLAIQASNIAVRQYSGLEKSLELRDSLSEIEQFAEASGKRNVAAIDERVLRFRSLMKGLERGPDPISTEEVETINRIEERFENYIARVNSQPAARDKRQLRSAFEDASASVGSFIQLKKDLVYRMAQDLRQAQEDSMRIALLLLSVFILLVTIGSFKIISAVTQPLSVLANFLDQVNVEDDLPDSLPGLRSNVPEISRVARSFEQLLNRLRGYRTLNVRRLLIEKRRADIIAASIADGIFLLRGEELLYVSPVGERMLGPAPETGWKGLNIAKYLNEQKGAQKGPSGDAAQREEDTRTSGLAAIRKAMSRTIPLEFEIETGEGRKLYYLLHAFPISDEIIERVEHSFHGPIEQLLDRWQANTLVLAQDVTLVRESQEAKSHFIATLSHEVKTPVTSLTMATRLLRKAIDQFPNPTHRALIQTCADDVDRMRKLIDDLLSVSRFDTLTQDLEISTVDLSKLVKQSVQYFQPQAFERGMEIAIQYSPNAKSIQIPMDATKVSWALSNLLTNALRHTPKGGKVEAQVSLHDEFAEVKIHDTGPGIDRNRQERIFDKFNPFYDLRIARSGSVGMGLAIAREIIVAHGGRIWVTSEPGHGAEFCFTLPLKRAESGAMAGKMTSRMGNGLSSNLGTSRPGSPGNAV